MFTEFLYILRAYGMKTSLTEWNMLMECLRMDLNNAGLTNFYHMARSVLVKRLQDYDRFDQAFSEYFGRIEEEDLLSEDLKKWLSKAHKPTDYDKDAVDRAWGHKTLKEIEEMMEQRLREQTEEHDGGKKWVGTGGQTAYGHSGYAPKGIRVMGRGRLGRALRVAGERTFRDFREDNTIQIRDFQVALKKLRLLAMQDDGPKSEFNVDRTITETGRNAGMLSIVMERPRKNRTRLLLLMDSGGSMSTYADLCSRLFNAVNELRHFKELKICYFHNCVYDQVYSGPECRKDQSISTERLLQTLHPEFKVILVGDAFMDPSEFYEPYNRSAKKTGQEWLQLLRQRFPHSVWMNPMAFDMWDPHAAFTVPAIGRIFPMFRLSPGGLEQGIKELRRDRN